MAKDKTIYTCTECGGSTPKWQGKCPHCGAWNTLIEGVAEAATDTVARVLGRAPRTVEDFLAQQLG